MSSLGHLYRNYVADLYPGTSQAAQVLRSRYLQKVVECQRAPVYHITLPTGTLYPCLCEPLLNDKSNLINEDHPEGSLGSWKTVRHARRRAPKRPREPSFEDYD